MNNILFTGRSAVGKSTIAKRVQAQFGYEWLDERGLLHGQAELRGYQRVRHWLAAEGYKSLVDVARGLTIDRMNHLRDINTPGLVLDGIYDRELNGLIRRTFPQDKTILVAITIEDELRKERLMGRLGTTDPKVAEAERSIIDGFKFDAGVEDAIAQADITIDNTEGLEQSIAAVMGELSERGYHPTKER